MQLEFSPQVCPVEVDRNQLEQVIVNLAVNARDAMPTGGVLTVASESIEETNEVTIIVSDTGTGMSEQTKAQIFDPFFTTKPKGKGTGLGLSTAHGIIAQSGGRITVSSELGKGTTFVIHLPRAKRSLKVHPAENQVSIGEIQRTTSWHGTETILLIEDEPDLRELLAVTLKINGYVILSAEDGESAILKVKNHIGPIHILLTDVVLPNMSGVEAAKTIRSLRPSAKIIYMTGYAGAANISINSGDTLLEKPVALETLLARIRNLLDEPKKLRA